MAGSNRRSEPSVQRDRRERPPRPRTSFVGRDVEVASLLELLRSDSVRLVSITGRSGAGKTRLAVEAARRLHQHFPGGAVFLDVSSADDVRIVPAMLAAALDLRVGSQRPEEALRRSLAYEPTLVVADDVDHVPGAGETLERILADSPDSRLLATAQSPLRLAGEHVVRLGPLAVSQDGRPAVAGRAALTAVGASPAIALFCDRASAVDHDFELTAANAGSVLELCRRLDGLPLAIELAAARARIMPPATQLQVLGRGSSLDLRSPAGPRPERHRELRSAIAVSHDLLGERERMLFRRMGAFEGGATLEALRHVCASPDWKEAELIDALMLLVDLNLVEPDTDGPEPRYELLPTIREFALERLAATAETDDVVDRHIEWFCALAREALDLDEERQLAALGLERDNLHAALGRLVEMGDVTRGLGLVSDIASLWMQHGFFPGPSAWLEGMLHAADERPIPTEVHARGLFAWVLLTIQQPDVPDLRPRVVARLSQGLELARSSGSVPLVLRGLWSVIWAVFVTADMAGAGAAASEGLALSNAAGDRAWQTRFEYVAGMAAQQMGQLGTAARLGAAALDGAQRSRDRASILRVSLLLHGLPPATPGVPAIVPSFDAMLEMARDSGDIAAEVWVLARKASRAMSAGDVAGGASSCVQGLEVARRVGFWHSGAFCIVALVTAAAARGEDAAVARLHGSIASVLQEVSVGLSPGPAAAYRELVEAARTRYGTVEFDGAVADAGLMDWDTRLSGALEYARMLSAPRPVPARRAIIGDPVRDGRAWTEPLTPREVDVLRQLATGGSNREIAEALGLRTKTVMHHSVSIYGKLGVRGRAEATAWAFRNGVMTGLDVGA